MRLATETNVTIGPKTISLRPSLRAAFVLEHKYNGFHKLLEAAYSGNLGAVSDIIYEGSGGEYDLSHYIDKIDDETLQDKLFPILPQIGAFLGELAGSEVSDAAVMGEPIPFAEYHKQLYRIATGWLGWSPEVAWHATPAEILEAQNGLRDFLRAKYGTKTDDDETIDRTDGRLAPDKRAQLNALGDLSVTSTAQVR